MLHYVIRLIINLFELIIIEFSIKKKSFDQSLGQDHNFSVYEHKLSIKTGENLRVFYHVFTEYNNRQSVLQRYNLFRGINSAILNRESALEINNRDTFPNNRNTEATGQFVFSRSGINRNLNRFAETRSFLGRQIILRDNQQNLEDNSVYYSDSE